MGQLDHVAEAVALARGVVLEQRAGVVEQADGVRDTALERLGQGPAVARGPVREQLAGLVGAPQHRRDDLPGVPGGARVEPRAGELGGADQRGGAHVRAVAQPAQQPEGPLRLGDGEFAHQRGVAVVAVAAALVEGVLADHVGHGEQEQLGLGVPDVAGAAVVVAGELPGRGHRRTRTRLGLADVEPGHATAPLGLLVSVGGRHAAVRGARDRAGRGTADVGGGICLVLYRIELPARFHEPPGI